MKKKQVIGRLGSGLSDAQAVSISNSSTTPPARARVSHVHRGGLASLRGHGSHRPYWRDGNLSQPWSNEDDPSTRTLFYTTADMYQDPETGDVYYDGEDDAAAVGAFQWLRDLFKKKQAPEGVAPPGELRRGTGGPSAKPLAPALGVETKWSKHELAPGIQLRLRRGVRVAVANQGTADAPVWSITPGVRDPVAGFNGAGVIPLLALAIKGGSAAATRRAARKVTSEVRQEPMPPEEPATKLNVGPGSSVEIGRGDITPQAWGALRGRGFPAGAYGIDDIAGMDLVGSILGGQISDVVGSFGDEGPGDVLTGALLIDSDGRKIRI